VRRLLIVVVLLLGVAVAADRVAAVAAERVVAERIQADESLDVRPGVSIRGVPFLTQLARGRYDDVTVTVHDLRRGELDIDQVRAHMTGVHVPFSDVVRQRVDRVRIDAASAEIRLTYAAVNHLLEARGFTLGPGGDGEVHVTASAAAGGAQLSAGADVPLSVQDDVVSIDTRLGTVLQIPLPRMPFGIELKSARATPDGLTVVCTAQGLVITR